MTGAGVLTFNAAPDFEAARNTYTLVIEVRDSKDGAGKADTVWDDAVTLTVNVTDVAEPPDAPADLAVSSTANGLTVTWTAPVMTGKPPLTGYDVEQRLRTSAAGAVTPVWGAWTDASHTGTAASSSITGLTPEAVYQVRVRAVNAEGESGWTSASGAPGHPNRAPAFPSDSVTLDVDENTASGADIDDSPAATDLDGDSLTYSLGGTGSAHFAIVAGSGQLQTKGALDHEKKASYSVVVTASDGTLTDTIAVTIEVNDLNEAPSFDDGETASVNAAENQTAVATPEVTDPEKDDLTYRLDTAAVVSSPATNDHASFTMTGAGVLTFKAAPDFEAAKNTYTLVIEVRDSKDGAGKADTVWDDAVTLTVNVTDVAEPPDAPADLAVSSTANGLTVTWTAPVMTGKPPLTGYDVEQRLRTSAAGAVTPVWGAWTDASHTGTAASASITGLTPEATYQVRVRAVNAEGNGEWAGPEEGVPGHPNRAPAFPSGSVTLDVDENTVPGADIDDAGSALTATDLDGDSLTYSLGGTGSAHFAIVAGSGQLQTKGALDHEKKASYSVVVTASDGTLTDTIAVTIEVNDLNEAPSFDAGETASVNAAENQTAVATPEVTDPEKDDLTYRLDTAAAFTDPGVSNDHASFTMTGAGVLTFKAAPDFEAAKNTYTLVIEVRDSKDSAGKADTDWDDAVTLTVNVTDVAEPPDAPADLAVSSTANGLTVTWTAPVMTGKPPLTGYDVEQRLRTSADDAVTPVWGAWTDASHTGTAASSSITGLTPEAVYQVRVRAVNAEGESGWTSASGAPGHPNRAPAFPSDSVTLDVDENTASGADIDDSPAATDLDGDSLTYSLGGTGSAHFAIAAGSGQLQTKGALDHEKKASYSVVVTASDGTLTDTIAVTINVNDLNEAPSFDAGASASVNAAENQTAVATPKVTDPEKDDLTYRLDTAAAFTGPAVSNDHGRPVSNDHGSFTMTGAGVLTFKAAPDFEAAKNSYTLVVEVRDSKDGAGKDDTDWDDSIILTVNVTDVNEAPGAPTGLKVSSTANGLTASWTAPVMTGKPVLTGYDVEHRLRTSAADSVSEVWGVWTDVPHSDTTASANIGSLTAGEHYQVRVRGVNDEGDGVWAGPVLGVPGQPNRAPVYTDSSKTFSVDENTASATNIGKPLTATDPDGDTLEYSLGSGGDDANFAIDSKTGQLKTKGDLDHETKDSYSVTVTAADPSGLTDTIAVTINVTGVNEAPFYTGSGVTLEVDENTAPATDIGSAVTATDPDGDTLEYALGGTDSGHFAIVASSGQLKTSGALNHENKASYAVTVTAEDPSGLLADIAVTINVTDVNEPPSFADSAKTLEVAENTAPATDIGDPIAAIDPEGDTLTYTIDGADAAHFVIVAGTGQLKTNGVVDLPTKRARRARRAAPDDGTTDSYSIVVSVSDGKDANGDADDSFDDTIDVTVRVRGVRQASAMVDYDIDDDKLIELANLARLNATRWDLNGDGAADDSADQPSYDAAFPNAMPGMGCPDIDGDGVADCRGYELVADLNFDEDGDNQITSADGAYWNGGAGWDPIGGPFKPGVPYRHDKNMVKFRFDGNGNTISNLFINRPAENNMGLFSATNSGMLKNVGLENVTVVGDATVGALVGSARSIISSSYATGEVSGRTNVGGLVGSLTSATMKETYAAVNVRASGSFAGGLVGFNGGHIYSSYATGAVFAARNAGGLTSFSQYSNRPDFYNWLGRIRSSYSTGPVFADNRGVGLVEINSYSDAEGHITNSYWDYQTGGTRSGAGIGYDTASLREPTGYTGIYANWNQIHKRVDPWDFGTSSDYPALKVDWNGDGIATVEEFGNQDPGRRSPAFNDPTPRNFSVAEKSPPDTNIGGPLPATEPDGNPITYALNGEDGRHFVIDPNTGQIKAKDPLYYEARNTYQIRVAAFNERNGADWLVVNISVTQAAQRVPRDAVAGRLPGQPGTPEIINVEETSFYITWTAPETGSTAIAGYGIQYKLTSEEDSAYADVKPTPTGTVTGYHLVNRDRQTVAEGTSYTVRVRARHAKGWWPWSEEAIVVTASAVASNNPPSFAAASATVSVAENTAANTAIANSPTATDPDAGDTLTYTLGTTTDDLHFTIDSNSGQLQTSGALDYESKDSYTVTVTATDGGGLADSISVTITVTDVADTPPGQPDTPEIINVEETSFRVTWTAPTEGSSAITGYGIQYKLAWEEDSAYADAKPTKRGTVTGYNLVNGGGQTVAEGTSYAVRVRAKNAEGWGLWSDAASVVTAGAPPANNPPSFAAASATVSVAENTAANTAIANSPTATDPDAGDTLTYTLGTTTDDLHFTIDSNSGQLQTSGALDYESQDSYTVTVTATDGGGLSASIDVTITVTDVADTPPGQPDTPPGQPDTPEIINVAETSFRVTWTAPAEGSSAITGYGIQYKLAWEEDSAYADAKPTKRGTVTGYNLVNGGGQTVAEGTSYAVRVRAKNAEGWGLWSEAASVVTAGAPPANNPPSFAAASATVSVAENTAAGTDIGDALTATDLDAGDTLTYTLGTTMDDGHFAIDAGSGQIRTKGDLDYEGKDSYAVTVTATDGGGLADSIAVTITVTDVADTPPGQPDTPEIINVEETSFRVTWTAPTEGSSAITGYGIQYKLAWEEDSAYADAKPTKRGTVTGYNLVNGGGQTVAEGTSYAVRVRAKNAEGWGLWSDAASVVTAGAPPANNPPSFAAASATVSVAENTAAGTDIGDALTATDLDAGDTLTYTLGTTMDDGHFAIDAGSGQIRTKGDLDYEGKDSYAVTVTATDGGGLADSIAVTITVTDVADTPPGQPDTPEIINVEETSFRVTWTAPAEGSSAITGYGIQYKLAWEEDSAYADAKPTKRGTVTGYNLVNGGGQTVAEGTSYAVRVRAKNAEGWGLWSDAASVVTAGAPPANNPPSFAAASATVSVAENTAAGTDIGDALTATDLDAGDTLTYTLGTTMDDGHFAIDAGSGQIRTKGDLDYESKDSYTVTVTATDGGGLSASIAVTITVTNVAERVDYDADGDGLIEVANLAQLHAIRLDLDGDGASENAGYSDAFPDAAAGMGCPDSGCSGYELAADLDFDTDGNGDIDADDAYWNGGAGWEPLGGNVGLKRPSDPKFNAVFDGNGHTIANLFIDRPGRKSVGLFGAVGRSGTIRNLSLTNANVASQVNVGALVGILFGVVEAVHADGSVSGDENVGGLAGFVHEDGRVRRSYATARVTGAKTNVGGLAGHLRGAIEASYATGSVTSGDTAGGLVGVLLGTVETSYATGAVQGGKNVGGLVGLSRGATVTASYWNSETSGQADSRGGEGKTTAELSNPTGASGIYAGWDAATWDFGTGSQYPALKADWDGDGMATAAEFGSQVRAAPVVANRAPYFAGSAAEVMVAENTVAGTAIGGPVEATEPDGDSLTYALGTTADDGHFAIDADSGQLQTSGALDYEGQISYAVTVSATDAVGLSASIAVTITVTNVNDAPYFADSAAEVSVAENTAAGTAIGDPVEATDPDAVDSLTYTLGSEADDGHFAIDADSGQLKTKGDLDYEGASSYAVTVTATDSGGLTAIITVTIKVDDVEEAPRPGNVQAALQADGSVLVTWEAPAGAGDDTFYRVRRRLDTADSSYAVIARRVEDADNDGAAEYRDDDGDLEAGQSYLYSVRAFDGDGDKLGQWTEGVKVSIPAAAPAEREKRAANNAPTFADSAAEVSVAENTAAGADIGAPVEAKDPDGDSLTYALGSTADDGHFTIDADSGQLQTSGALDYESKDSYAVTVTATDGGGLTASVEVTITVTDVADTPPGQPDTPEIINVEETSFRVTWTAAAAGSSAITGYGIQYKLASEEDSAYADVTPTPTGTVTGYNLVNGGGQTVAEGTSYAVRVRAKNAEGWGLWSDAASVVTAGAPPSEASNNPPSFTAASATVEVAENTAANTAIGDALTATDPDAGDTLTYTLDGKDSGHFAIDADSGQLQTSGALDYESQSSYTVTVTATDGDGLTASVEVTITVTDVADTPPGQPATPEIINVEETSFRVTWTAPAEGSSAITGYGIQYKLASEEDSAYADVTPTPTGTVTGYNLVNGGGQTVAEGTSYAVRVRAKNAEGWGLWSDAASVVTAGAPPSEASNNPPSFTAASATVEVAENTAANTAIGDALTATDPDAGDTLTYTLDGKDSGHFAIGADSGQLQTSGALDYESQSSYTVTVTATDGDGLTASVEVTITVTDVADTPPGQPATPEIINVEETSFRVTWTAPAEGSSAITGYGIQYKLASEEDSAYADVNPTPTGTATGYNLVNRDGQTVAEGTSYAVRVRAKNAEGWGPWSEAASAVTAGAAPSDAAPANGDETEADDSGQEESKSDSYQATAVFITNQGRVLVKWDKVDGAAYYLIRKNGQPMPGRTDATSLYDADVEEGTRYEYRITAYDSEDSEDSVLVVMTAATGE